jgi:tetratricopeptide (TPR) repeat protein
MSEDKLDSAETYLNKATELETDPGKKADLYYDLANINYKKGNKVAARDFALKAVEANDTLKEKAYTLIGHMYMASFEQCKKGKSMVDDRAIFLAAYDMYQKAGNAEGMSNAKEQFPSKEDIFNLNIKAGDSISIGCWINATTTIRTRD